MANTIQPNNNTSLYNSTGNAVPTTGNLDASNINATGNVTVGGFIIANGSITTESNFVGDLVGNVTGNVTGNIVLSGGNTEIIYNNNGVTGSSPAFTFNQSSNVVSLTGNITANYLFGNGSQLSGLPATYSNANVEALLPVYTGDFAGANINLTGYVSAAGNVTGNYILGNGSQLTGITANYSNANVQAFLPTYSGDLNPGNVSASGNVTAAFLKTSGAQGNIVGANYVSANFYLGDGGLLSNISSSYGNAQVATFLSAFGSNTVSTTGTVTAGNITGGNIATGGVVTATGNITGNYFIGNGSQLTGLPATYNNANVADFLANSFGSNSIATTGNITAANFIGNIAAANVVGTVATANTATTAGTVTANAQANITSLGTLTVLAVTGNITSATVSTTGNITGNYLIGDGSLITNLPGGSYGNANVANYLPTFSGNLSAGNVSATGNITGSYILGNGSQLTDLTGANVTGTVALATQANVANTANAVAGANVSGSVAQANYANIANSVSGSNVSGSVAQATFADTANAVAGGNVSGQVANAVVAGTVYTNAQPNITSVGTLSSLSVTGNIATGGILTDGYYYANGAPFSGGGGSTYGDANVNSLLAAWGSNTISTSGNITAGYFLGDGSQLTNLPAGNAVLSGNLAGNLEGNGFGANALSFVNIAGNLVTTGLGTSNIGNLTITTGNASTGNSIVISSVNSYQSNTTPNPGRINVGSGKNGDWTNTADITTNARGSRMWIADEYIRYDNGVRNRELSVFAYANLAGGNVGTSNANSRMGGIVGEMYVINGNSVNTGVPFVTGIAGTVVVGQGANTANATLAAGCGILSFLSVNAGSSAGNLVQYSHVSTFNGNVTNWIGYSGQVGGSANVSSNAIGFFHPNVTSTVTSLSTSNIARAATNYYAFRNDDDLAKSKLGMLDSFHELNANTATTTGNITISKTDGQVQTIYPTGNVTIAGFTNFVTRATKPNSTFVSTADTVTLIIQQGATPYTITMPVGNTQIRYAGGISTVGSTANTTVMISVTGVYDINAATNEYLVTISPEFS